MIDLKTENLISLREAANRLAVDLATVRRWVRVGHHGRKLAVLAIGPTHVRTSLEELERWSQHFQAIKDKT